MCPMSHSRSESDLVNTTTNHNNNTNHDQLQSQLSQLLVPNSGQRASFRVIETMDDHMDIINLYFRPMYSFPSWTLPRDYVLFRYWRFDIFVSNRKKIIQSLQYMIQDIRTYVKIQNQEYRTTVPIKLL